MSTRELLNSSGGESHNPWSSSSAYINVGSLGKIISLAKNSGLLPRETSDAERNEIKEKVKSPSVKLIAVLNDLSNLQKTLNKVKVLLHCHQLDQETKDITDADILESKTEQMEELSLHLSALIDKKDELVSRLQQPFVGEYINIDATYHRFVSETVPLLSSVLSYLTNHLDSIKWSGNLSFEDGEVERILTKVSSALAQLQKFQQSLSLRRNVMTKLL